ncbi:hypothetical protein [Sphingomonas morindae]|uniref:Uncharacterized protein n=1 Tax=Sphingomonas morindae TaxID=1541170 RepID=A0ABY4X453_9SPHN|nr:hypothetical protein [Sphingomonas morindae]USI71627.1 hypothetical protein LHA26_09790 [Sphingomonas morindae]
MEIFRNRQWLVTDTMVERADGGWEYFFTIDRVFEINSHRGGRPQYDWPVHMAEKAWVDVDAFNEAFEKALRYQSAATGKPVDEEMLSLSLHAARQLETERSAYRARRSD